MRAYEKWITFIFILVTNNCKYLGNCLSEFDVTSQSENVLRPARVITDLETIYGCYGVPIDFSYNETTSPEATYFGSVPGCPQSIDGYPWIYYGQPPRCYLAGFRGPCKPGEKLIPRRGTPFGTCGCECLLGEENMKNFQQQSGRFQYCKTSGSTVAPHGQIYDVQTRKCYNAFQTFEDSSGSCKPGTAITEWTKDYLTCQKVCSEDTRGLITTLVPGESQDCRKMPVSILAVAGSTSILQGQNCPNGQTYSQKLKMCTSKSGIEIL